MLCYPYDEPKLLKGLQERACSLESNLDYRCQICKKKRDLSPSNHGADNFAAVSTGPTDRQRLATPFCYFKTSQRDISSQSDHESKFSICQMEHLLRR